MDTSKIPLMSMITGRMNWLNQRQELLSRNVANADTPNFSASDLKTQSFSEMLSNSGAGGFRLKTTNPMHYAGGHNPVGAGGGAPSSGKVIKRKPDETSINKNSVQLEEEMMKVAETQTDYSLMVNLYKKQMGMLRLALGRK